MQQIKLSEITIEKIKNRELETIIPEIYELERIVENNRSHINDPVFTHTLSVLVKLENILAAANKKVSDYLSQKIDYYSRKELLLFATVFHDIGKKETLEKDGETTRFPGHEAKSAEKIKEMMPRFNLSDKEKEMVIKIIGNHGFFHRILDCPEDDLEKKGKEFREKYPDIFLETVLFTTADIFGGQLIEKNPVDFNFRIKFLNRIIDNY